MQMQRWLAVVVRRGGVITALTVMACTAFAARAAAALVAAETLTPAPRGRVITPAAPTPPAPPRVVDGGQLVARNMFCSSCGPAELLGAVDFVLAPAVLIETSVGREPSATLRVLTSEVQGSWGLGDTVPGLGQLDRITGAWVELVDARGRRGRLSLRDPKPVGGASDTAMSEAPAGPAWARRVTRLDEQTYEVERGLVRELVGIASTPGGARFVPIFEGGEIRGLRILGVGPTTIPAAFGLKSRDTLTAIDGEPIRNVQQAIDLYAKLDQVSSVELSGTRDGKPLVRSLRLR